MKLSIPTSLLAAGARADTALKVELLRVPDAPFQFRVLPAHPLAVETGWIARAGQQMDGGRFRIILAGESEIVIEGIPGAFVEVYDDGKGKRQRRAELDGEAYDPQRPVVVIGCGSLGTMFLALQVRHGHRLFIIVDPDRVESSNVTKSLLYNETYTGLYKVEAVSHALRCIEPGTVVLGFPNRWNVDFVHQHGDEILARNPALIYFSADDLEPLYELVCWLDSAHLQGRAVPQVLVQLVFVNARAGFVLHWDPTDQNMPCPGCFFAKNPRIFDRRNAGEEIDQLTYSPTRLAATSSPQIACDIAHHVALGVSYATALLWGTPERLAVVGEKPWLYSVALRHPSADTSDFLEPWQAGNVFIFPGYDGKPDPGCACCRAAGRLGDVPPGDMVV